MTEALTAVMLIFGIVCAAACFRLAFLIRRNRRMTFSEHDYQIGIAFDRKNNRILTTRRLKMSAIRRLLS